MTIGLAANQANPEVTVNQMVDGYLSKSVAGSSDVDLTDFESTYAVVELTGALTGSIAVTIPDTENTILVRNSTTGLYTLTFTSLTGSGVVIPQGTQALLFCDGSDVYEIVLSGNRATSPSSSSGTLTLDLSTGNEFNVTLTENVTTLNITNVPAGGVTYLTIDLTQDGTGGWSFDMSGIQWAGGTAPTLTTTAGVNSVLKLRTKDGGTTFQGQLIGDNFS